MRERELSACSIQKRKMNRYTLRHERHILLASSAVQQPRLTVRQGVRRENSKWYLRCCCRRLSHHHNIHTLSLSLLSLEQREQHGSWIEDGAQEADAATVTACDAA